MMNRMIIPPRTVYVAHNRLRVYNDSDENIVVYWQWEKDMPYRTVETTPEEDRESKALFINSRGIADSSGRWISRDTNKDNPPTEIASDFELARSEDETVADNNATPTEPTDVRLNIFKLFE
jgi:hypothetical protein